MNRTIAELTAALVASDGYAEFVDPDTGWTDSRCWALTEEGVEVRVAGPADALPPGWSPAAVAAVLLALPGERRACLWAGPPFPPAADTGDEWPPPHLSGDTLHVFPSGMAARSPRDEIVRLWSYRHRNETWGDGGSLARAAVGLEDPDAGRDPDAPVRAWAEVVAAVAFGAPTPPPVRTALAARVLARDARLLPDHWAAKPELVGRAERLAADARPAAREFLRPRAAGGSADAARLLLLLGEPADADALRGFDALGLGEFPLTAGAVAVLAALPGLRRLELSHAHRRWGATGLAPLAALTGLTHLWLAGLGLQNSDLRFLRDLAALEFLDLHDNRITDGGLSQLMRLPALRRLDLRGNEAFGENVLGELRRRLPGCEVVA